MSISGIYRTKMTESKAGYRAQHRDNTAAPSNTEDRCSCCQIECEMEWRTRISLADAQRIILQHFRGKADVWIDEYRVKRFAQYQRRIGARSHYARYSFSTIGDFLSLHGLSPLYSISTVNDIACPDRAARKLPEIRTYPFSELKTTNCAHTFYTFSASSSLQKNTAWPRIFVFKRSLEIGDFEVAYDDNSQEGVEDKPSLLPDDDDPPVDQASATASVFSKAIDNVFADYERIELDRSDNNLGVAYIRKMYCFIPLRGQMTDKDNRGMLRLAVYSIFDEYQQIRHEIGVEYEFDHSECHWFADKLLQTAEAIPNSACISSRGCSISIGPERLDALLMAMSQIVDDFVAPYVDYVEKPMVKINVDWLQGITSISKIRMLSYTIPSEQVENEVNFVDYVTSRLTSLTRLRPDFDRQSEQSSLVYRYFLRRKLDGERLYATYDGGHWLCMSNGMRLDLRNLSFRETAMAAERQSERMTVDDADKACRYLFSVDFVYQVERVDKNNYYLTEVVAVRHSYSTVLSSLVHTFSPSRNFYRATDEQVWPYALIGTGLDNHATASLVNFWVTSACPDTAGFLTRDMVDTLRKERRMLANLPKNNQYDCALNTDKSSGQFIYDDMSGGCSSDDLTDGYQAIKRSSLSPAQVTCEREDKNEKKKEKKAYGLFTQPRPSSSISVLSDTAGSGGDDSFAQNEENDNDDETG